MSFWRKHTVNNANKYFLDKNYAFFFYNKKFKIRGGKKQVKNSEIKVFKMKTQFQCDDGDD